MHAAMQFVYLFCLLLASDAQQLLVNGNFESGALAPWSVFATSLASGQAHDGRYYVYARASLLYLCCIL